jgi:hypothetical protein
MSKNGKNNNGEDAGFKTMKVFGSSDVSKALIRSMEVEIGGETGVIHYKSLSGRQLHQLQEGTLSGLDGLTRICSRLSETLVNADGSPLMTLDELLDTPVETLNYLMESIADDTKKRKGDANTEVVQGEDSSGIPSSVPHTN